ncbi:MAG: alkanesulfonate transporter ATP-binding protein [Gammaproteobacteria bacterium]|nr:alkanesulfonate transporter ATP-binding protein [Gammaproteobacteria bacterium]
MDWNDQLRTSLIWLGEAFVISSTGLAITIYGLALLTGWGRMVRRISGAYFNPSRSALPLAWLALIVLMTLFSVRLSILLSFWNNGFYSAMQNLDAQAFWFMLFVFATLATVYVMRALLSFYLRQAFLIRWRIWLTNMLMERWLRKQNYYRSQYVPEGVDNPDQRIQQDVESFVGSSLALSMGLLDSVVSLFSFSIILWGLSGTLMLFGWKIPRAMVFMVYLYVIISTVFAVRIGRPLIRLNFLNEQFSASFRYALIRLREYGESIAFYRGETVERDNLVMRFGKVIQNMWAILFRSLKFQGFNFAVSQAAVVFPFIVQAPRLLSRQITLGDVMQTAQSFGQVESALSFFRTSYDDFAGYRAVVNRLSGFLDLTESAERLGSIRTQPDGERIALRSLTVRTAANVALVKDLSLELPPTSSLLIRGRSGVGKTTLLRALAGLWPYVDGTIVRPLEAQSLFLPQKPYLPLGTLRLCLYYPSIPAQTDDLAAAILRRCQLEHLVARLDEEEDWTRILSLGEQQRLAIGRVLLNRPLVVFLDEASSALDEGLEHAMYRLLRESLPGATLVSVGHRSSLLGFHTRVLELLGEGKWRLQELPEPAANAPTEAMLPAPQDDLKLGLSTPK